MECFPCKGLWNAYEDVLFCYNRSMFIPRGSTTDRQGKDIFSFKKRNFYIIFKFNLNSQAFIFCKATFCSSLSISPLFALCIRFILLFALGYRFYHCLLQVIEFTICSRLQISTLLFSLGFRFYYCLLQVLDFTTVCSRLYIKIIYCLLQVIFLSLFALGYRFLPWFSPML